MPVGVLLTMPIPSCLSTHSMVLLYDWSSGWTSYRNLQILESFLLSWFLLISSIPWLLLSCLVLFELVPFQWLLQVLGFPLYWSCIWIFWNIGCVSLQSSRTELLFLLIPLLFWLVLWNCPYNLPILLCITAPEICYSSFFGMFSVSYTV